MKVYKTTDFTLPWYDFTTLNAIETCNRWGLVTYRRGKAMIEPARRMPLEAGLAMHEFFAAWNVYDKPALRDKHFGDKDKLELLMALAGQAEPSQRRLTFALEVLHATGFYDDPGDTRCTLANIETACIYWSEMQTGQYEIIDVEVPFDITIDIVQDYYSASAFPIRYVGRIDAIAKNKKGELYPLEYKSASRIDQPYLSQWLFSPQLTGYHLALRTLVEDFGADYVSPYATPPIASYAMLEAIMRPIPKNPRTSILHDRSTYPRGEVQYEIFEAFVRRNVAVSDLWTAEAATAPVNVSQ